MRAQTPGLEDRSAMTWVCLASQNRAQAGKSNKQAPRKGSKRMDHVGKGLGELEEGRQGRYVGILLSLLFWFYDEVKGARTKT